MKYAVAALTGGTFWTYVWVDFERTIEPALTTLRSSPTLHAQSFSVTSAPAHPVFGPLRSIFRSRSTRILCMEVAHSYAAIVGICGATFWKPQVPKCAMWVPQANGSIGHYNNIGLWSNNWLGVKGRHAKYWKCQKVITTVHFFEFHTICYLSPWSLSLITNVTPPP